MMWSPEKFRKTGIVLLAALFCAGGGLHVGGLQTARAAQVSAISISGNARVEEATIRSYLSIRPGQQFSAKDIDNALKALFATGLFEDVSIRQRGNTLIVNLRENPIVNEVSFEGNKRLSDTALSGIVRLGSRGIYSRSRVQLDVQNILEAYRRAGRFRATVNAKRIERKNNRIDIVFEIDEGTKTGVEQINFIGNQLFSDRTLRNVINTRRSDMFSWLRRADTYDPDRVEDDKEQLRQYYIKNGYADFRVVSAVADLDRESNVFRLTFTVDEGEAYKFGDIEISSSISALSTDELRSLLYTKKGQSYNSLDIDKTIEEISLELGRLGYAFAQIRPRARRDLETREISITYQIDEGPRVYIERIEILGNDRTREHVIRREFSLAEGDAFNRALIERAERRLRNLGFFSSVRINTSPGSARDRIVVTVNVTEQNTGSVSFGVGYSSLDRFIGDISFSEENFLGRGNAVRASIGGGRTSRTYDFSFTEPFLFGRRLSLSLEAYQRLYRATSYRVYERRTVGGGLTLGLPLREEELRLNLTYRAFRTRNSRPKRHKSTLSYALQEMLGSYVTSAAGYTLILNKLDNNVLPTEGYYGEVGQEFAGLGGTARYVRSTVEGRYYHALFPTRDVIGSVRAIGSHIAAFGGRRLRVSDQLEIPHEYLRGFQPGGIGPRDSSTNDALGGRFMVAGTAEAEMPMPLLPPEIGLSIAMFADAGSVWDVDPGLRNCVKAPTKCGFTLRDNWAGADVNSNSFKLRASAGIGLRWQSPFGPLKMDFAWPIRKEKGDRRQLFRLSGGTRF